MKYASKIGYFQRNLMSLVIQLLHIYVGNIICGLQYCVNIWDENLFRKNLVTLIKVC